MDHYTAKLANHGQDFDEFILLCARDVSHLEHMRDRPVEERPETPHKTLMTVTVEAAEARVKELNEATDEESRIAIVDAYLKERNTELDQDIAGIELEMERYTAMSDKVIAWEPSPEYATVKNIAMNRLGESTRTALEEHITLKAIRDENLNFDSVFQALCEKASRDLTDATAGEKARDEQHEQSSKWIDGLLEDLKKHKPK
jgi:hypothetical protein